MQGSLKYKRILVGVTGGIAAYKIPDLIRRLRDCHAEVRVVMTSHAKEFITPLTMQAVSGHPVHDDLFDLQAEAAMGHIELARWADAIVIAPASADCIARLRQGGAADLLTTLCLATTAPLFVAPAMNQAMWKNTLTQENLQVLQEKKGVIILNPTEGLQACGDNGPGRMMEPLDIVKNIATHFQNGLLTNKKVVITAGPTQEALDPVRYLSNGSSGKMGYAMAQAAIEACADVSLISGPVNLSNPHAAIKLINVVSAEEMRAAVMREISSADIFISVAAVADYRCKTIATHKFPKSNTLTLELEKTPDIVAEVASLPNKPFVVGFAAETENIINKAKNKLQSKNLDMIIANDAKHINQDTNVLTALWNDNQQDFPLACKHKLARQLIELIAALTTSKHYEMQNSLV